MTSAVRRLLRTDEQQLRTVKAALARGRFVIVVADDAVWSLARAAIGIEPVGDFVLESGDDVMRMFTAVAAGGGGAVFLHVGEKAAGAMAALNLNRDTLKGRTSRFLLRLRGLDAYRRFVREAPDAYSVRDGMAIIDTQAAVALGPSPEGNPRIDIESMIAGERSPQALLDLGQSLLGQGRRQLAHHALERGIALLSRKARKKGLSTSDRSDLAALHYYRADEATREDRRLHIEEALRVLGPVRSELQEQYINILRYRSDYYGNEIDAVEEALRSAEERTPHDTDHILLQVSALANACYRRDDVPGARAALERLSAPWGTSRHNRLAVTLIQAGVLRSEGRWREARTMLEEALRDDGTSANLRQAVESLAVLLATILADQGELETGLELIASIEARATSDLRLRVRRVRGELDAFRGAEVPAYVPPPGDDVTRAIQQAAEDIDWCQLAIRAGLLPEECLRRMDAAIAALAAHVAEVARTDPPWTRIDTHLLIADQHLVRAGGEQDAIAAAQRALSLARKGAPELTPACVRRIAVATLRSGSAEDLDALLDEASRASRAHHLPGQAAHIAGLHLWRAVQQHGDVGPAEQALEEAFNRSGNVLLQAAVLLQTGRGAGRRDLIARARRIYHSLPWPEREGRCLEALGMKDAARARYESFGFRLSALAVDRGADPEPIGA